jgi:hypothetical protein
MPLSVAIDSALVAVPGLAANEQEAEIIVQRIIYWSRAVRGRAAVQFVQLSNVSEILAQANCFPSGPNIRALLQLFNLNHVYSSEDVRQSVNAILQFAHHAAEIWGVEVLRNSNCQEIPDLTAHYIVPTLYEAAIKLLTSAACAKIRQRNNETYLACGVPSLNEDVHLRCQIDDISIASPWDGVSIPFSVATSIGVIGDIEDLALRVGSGALWNMADGPIQAHFAIATRIAETRRESGLPAKLHTVPSFVLSSEFWPSVLSNNGGPNGTHASVVVDACARLVSGQPKNRITPFGGQKRARDGALAFRTHVTKRHEALRLMFWKCSGNVIELANIGPKNELTIQEGRHELAVKGSFPGRYDP